jgi:hypothetical protein
VATTPVIKYFYVFKQVRNRVSMRGVPSFVNSFVLQVAEEAFSWGIDAAMSSGTRRLGQISQNKRIQLPDDIALQAAMDLLGGHAFLRARIDGSTGPGIAAHPYHGDGPQGVICGLVSAPI